MSPDHPALGLQQPALHVKRAGGLKLVRAICQRTDIDDFFYSVLESRLNVMLVLCFGFIIIIILGARIDTPLLGQMPISGPSCHANM